MKQALSCILCLTATPLSSRNSPQAEEVEKVVTFAVISTLTTVFIFEGIPRITQYLKNCCLFSKNKNNTSERWAGPLPKELEQVFDHHKNPKKFQLFNLTPTHGYLLYGPPGTGKTLLAEILAKKLSIPLIRETSGNFFTMWQGSGTLHFSELLRKAHKCPQPKKGYFKCVVFIDEIDGVSSRAEGFNREEVRLTEQILTAITAPENRTILFVGATNIFESIDKALIRPGRLTPLYIGHPAAVTRKALFQSYFKKHRVAYKPTLLDALTEQTEGFSCAAIKHAIENGLYAHIKHPTLPFSECLEKALEDQRNHPLFES